MGRFGPCLAEKGHGLEATFSAAALAGAQSSMVHFTLLQSWLSSCGNPCLILLLVLLLVPAHSHGIFSSRGRAKSRMIQEMTMARKNRKLHANKPQQTNTAKPQTDGMQQSNRLHCAMLQGLGHTSASTADSPEDHL